MALQKLIFSFIFLFSTEFISSSVVQTNDVLQKGHLTLQNIQETLLNRLERLEIKAERLDRLETEQITMRNEQAQMKADQIQLQTKVDRLEKEKADYVSQIDRLEKRIQQLESSNNKPDGQSVPLGNDSIGRKWLTSEELPLSAGRAIVPRSCRDLVSLGHSLDGFYQVLSAENPKKMATVLCNFSGGSPTESTVGFLDVKTTSVQFYVQRNSSYSTVPSVLPWELARLNIGNAMDLETGVFTAPRDGVYHFHFTGATSDGFSITLRLNNDRVGEVFAGSTKYPDPDSASIHSTLQLKSGDRVDLYFYAGYSIVDAGNHFNLFTGWLDEEDLQF